ncbi:hypothetical protein L218DRAFT_1082026 [Marasmius fiardii PR-910]|nr:hypothetical protein L218DRAFT_1082026 [Marasmius fiardii PR-910]
MRSFTFFATLATAALSFASPIVNGVGAAAGEINHVAKGAAAGAAHVGRSCGACEGRTVPVILNQVTVDIQVAIQPFTYITKDNCTVAHITPVVTEVKKILSVAIGECTTVTAGVVPVATGVLSGAIAAIFTISGKVLSLVDIAGILALLCKIIFTALNCVLKVVAEADKQVILPLLRDIVFVLCQLLGLVLGLLGGLLQCLLPLIVEIGVVVKALGVADICATVGISF